VKPPGWATARGEGMKAENDLKCRDRHGTKERLVLIKADVGNVSSLCHAFPMTVGEEWRARCFAQGTGPRSVRQGVHPPGFHDGRFSQGLGAGGPGPQRSRLRSRPGLAAAGRIFSTPLPGTDLIACAPPGLGGDQGRRLSAAASAIGPAVLALSASWPAANRPRGVFSAGCGWW